MPTATHETSQDGEAIQGTWVAAAAELGGKPFPEEVRKSITMTLKDDSYTVTVGGNPDRGSVRLEPSARPKAMDITGTEGPNKGRTFLAIYELNGDTLKICYDLGGKQRPTEFKTTEGSQLFLVTYRREGR